MLTQLYLKPRTLYVLQCQTHSTTRRKPRRYWFYLIPIPLLKTDCLSLHEIGQLPKQHYRIELFHSANYYRLAEPLAKTPSLPPCGLATGTLAHHQ